jgi:hypothetical protein
MSVLVRSNVHWIVLIVLPAVPTSALLTVNDPESARSSFAVFRNEKEPELIWNEVAPP